MIIAANQPYFLPYLAYWQLINAADLFLIADDYAFIKGGWINRNRILVDGAPHYFGIEVQKASPWKYCTELRRCPINRRKKLAMVYQSYHKAPYFDAGYQLVGAILDDEETLLSEFLAHSIERVCAYLGITTPIGRTSHFEGNAKLKREERIYDFCHRLGGDTYINPIGGMQIYDIEAFRKQGITLKFLHMDDISYPQFGKDFVGSLSILDLIMFNAPERLHQLLGAYSFVGTDA